MVRVRGGKGKGSETCDKEQGRAGSGGGKSKGRETGNTE